MKNSILLSFILFSSLFLSSCNNNKLDIDVSEVDIDLKVMRMEQDLFNQDLGAIEKHQLLQNKYGTLYEVFFESMLREVPVNDPMAASHLHDFSNNKDMLEIASEIDSKFEDFSAYQDKLTEAFKHYHHYFPDSSLPIIVTFYSNFNANVFPMKGTLGIGLDMYLGSDHEIVKGLPVESLPQYIKDKMEEEYLVADAMKYYLFNRFFDDNTDDFVSTAIASGKIMYLLDAMMPNEADHIKMGYTMEENNWCKENEVNIWQLLVDEEFLYSKDQKVIMQFISDGPFTKGLPEDSPARVGFWIGWQMVRDYMEKTESSVLDLLAEKNYRKILKEYDPNE